MARRATSLGPKPSLFLFFCFFVFCFFFVFFLLFCFLVVSYKKNFVFPLEKGIFCLFSVFLFLSPLAFLASLFLCFSFFVSLFSSFLSFFLLVFLFCCLLVPCFCLFLSFSFFFAFLSWKEQLQNIKLQVLSSSIFLSFLVSCLFLFQVPFSYLCYFLILSYVFCSTSRFLISKQTTLKNRFFWSKGGLQQNGFFYQPVFWKMWKVIIFLVSLFWANFGWCSKKHYKNRYFSTFLRAKNSKFVPL